VLDGWSQDGRSLLAAHACEPVRFGDVFRGNICISLAMVYRSIRSKCKRIATQLKFPRHIVQLQPPSLCTHTTPEPGVDAAFIVAIAVLVDELFHDEKTT
jgi:hypothetical protein